MRVRQVILSVAALVVMALALGLTVLAVMEGDKDREAFKQRCQAQGGQVIDLGHNPVCKFGRLTIEYGD